MCEPTREEVLEQQGCTHYNCRPVEWHWSGKPRVMLCDDCGQDNYLEDTEE